MIQSWRIIFCIPPSGSRSFTTEQQPAETHGMKSHFGFIMTIITADKQLEHGMGGRRWGGKRNRRIEKVIESFGVTFRGKPAAMWETLFQEWHLDYRCPWSPSWSTPPPAQEHTKICAVVAFRVIIFKKVFLIFWLFCGVVWMFSGALMSEFLSRYAAAVVTFLYNDVPASYGQLKYSS